MADDQNLPAVIERSPAPVKMARDHASRNPREMVFVNNQGESVSPLRAHGTVVALIGGFVVLAVTGVVSWPVPVIMGGIVSWAYLQLNRALRGNALALHGRLEEAEKMLTPLARSPLAHPAYRGLARSTLAGIEMRRGNHAAALEWARKGSRFGWPKLSVAFCRLGRVTALVNLDRVAEARAFFDRYLKRVPKGDLLRHAHWGTELYLALAEGKHMIGADELHRRAREALGVTTGRTLLALLAWAHQQNGDVDQAWHLLRESLQRDDLWDTEKALPRLHAWMEAHRAEALADAPAESELDA